MFGSSHNIFSIHLNLIHLDLEEIGKGQLVRPKRRNKLIILKDLTRNKTIVSATSVAASYHPFLAETQVLFQTNLAFFVDILARGRVSLRALRFSLSVSLQQCSILILFYHQRYIYIERERDRERETERELLTLPTSGKILKPS